MAVLLFADIDRVFFVGWYLQWYLHFFVFVLVFYCYRYVYLCAVLVFEIKTGLSVGWYPQGFALNSKLPHALLCIISISFNLIHSCVSSLSLLWTPTCPPMHHHCYHYHYLLPDGPLLCVIIVIVVNSNRVISRFPLLSHWSTNCNSTTIASSSKIAFLKWNTNSSDNSQNTRNQDSAKR